MMDSQEEDAVLIADFLQNIVDTIARRERNIQSCRVADYVFNIIIISLILVKATFTCNKIDANSNLPENWPCEWNDGKIEFAFNFFLLSPKRLVSVVRRGIEYIEARSCLIFKEKNPIELAKGTNLTYLFFTFSDVLENCCLPFAYFDRRRTVLITPLCTLPVEVAHVILHAMGLKHKKHEAFSKHQTINLLCSTNCTAMSQKMRISDIQ
ncbi:uncharacterized protein LOC125067921 [Vanessa atalanta]|uniref:uncharacterized protein LOC125067921 n=1 Tax=Vanessa atalanta TaxID=42275 RepID=UPI001FCDD419|nr:uncharacterized protein LOC125067921 [Vanessa atalanta]